VSPPPSLTAALPQYEVGDTIGSGGMGVVYTAVHRPLGRQVAIKQLPGGRSQDPGMAARFDHEARLLASLDHPHIVPVYDYVRTDSEHLLVMEKLDGGTVWSRFHRDGLTGEQSCAIGLATLAGLHAAHQAGVLHLDVKPKNLLFTAAGVLKVADFGISQVVSEGATLVTRGGEAIGTPAYIAPEQALGNPLTPAADLYAAGTVLYELLSGVLPYESDGGALALLHQHVYTDPRPISGVAPALAEVVMRGLVRDPRERYRDAEAFATDLAAAATRAYGLGWLDRAGVPVHLTPRVAACATTGPVRGSAPVAVVRASTPEPPPSPTLADLGSATLVPAREVLRPPRSARWPAVAAALAGTALVGLLVVSLSGAVEPTERGGLGLVVNDGVDRVDLAEPVLLAGALPTGGLPAGGGTAGGDDDPDDPDDDGPGGDDQLTARLRLSAAGVPLGEAVSAPLASQDGRWLASVQPPPLARWLAGGAVTGEVQLVQDGAPVASQRFTVRPAQNPLLSAMGAGSVLLLMFTLAYLESILRSVRRRQLRRSGPVLAAPVGAVFAAAAGLLGFVLTRTEPLVAVLLAAAALGAAAAAFATVARSRSVPAPQPRRPAQAPSGYGARHGR